jgi:hypothetical protein
MIAVFFAALGMAVDGDAMAQSAFRSGLKLRSCQIQKKFIIANAGFLGLS